MSGKIDPKRALRLRRKARVRKKIAGTPQRPRVSVFRSLRHIHAQAIDDQQGVSLASASTVDKELRGKVAGCRKVEAARAVGELLAARLQAKQVAQVVFDRGGFRYGGRVAALAQGVREAGITV
ncbi:MAG: 50S ribosomal protein L18 [Myxococcota bacterium]